MNISSHSATAKDAPAKTMARFLVPLALVASPVCILLPLPELACVGVIVADVAALVYLARRWWKDAHLATPPNNPVNQLPVLPTEREHTTPDPNDHVDVRRGVSD
jgi:hypothetical protein